MNIERIASYVGFSLTVVGAVLLFFVSWVLGFVFLLFVLGIIVWYLQTKRKGDLYLKEVAELMGYTFERGGFGYGRVVGKWREHEIEVSVNKDYDSLRGLTGFIVNSRTMNSAVGVLAGITNFTSVKIKHNKPIRSLDLDKRTFLDDHLTLYLPECNRITGLPLLKPEDLVRNIDSRIDQHKAVEK